MRDDVDVECWHGPKAATSNELMQCNGPFVSTLVALPVLCTAQARLLSCSRGDCIDCSPRRRPDRAEAGGRYTLPYS